MFYGGSGMGYVVWIWCMEWGRVWCVGYGLWGEDSGEWGMDMGYGVIREKANRERANRDR